MNYANIKEKWEFASCNELCQYERKIRNWKFQWTMQILKKWEFASFNELCQYERKMRICKLQWTMPIWKKDENLQVSMNYANIKEKWIFRRNTVFMILPITKPK